MHDCTRRWLSGLALTLIAATACNDPIRPRALETPEPGTHKSEPIGLGPQVHARLPIAARLKAELESRRCGEPLRLRGIMTLDGLNGRFTFRWRDAAREKSIDVALLPPGQSIAFEVAVPAGSSDAPEYVVQFLDASGRALSRPLFAGRCGEAPRALQAAFQLDTGVALDVVRQGCRGELARATAAGELALPGLHTRVRFTDASPVQGKRGLASEVVLPLLAFGTGLELPRVAVPVPRDAEVFFSFVDSRGNPLSLEFPLGPCGDLPL